MDEAAAVRFGDRLARLEDVLDRVLHGDDTEAREFDAKVHSVEQLEHHVRSARRQGADVEHPRDVLALDRDGGASFSEETCCQIAPPRELVTEKFDGDRGAEREVRRGHDDAHPAFAEDAVDAILLEQHLAGCVHGHSIGRSCSF